MGKPAKMIQSEVARLKIIAGAANEFSKLIHNRNRHIADIHDPLIVREYPLGSFRHDGGRIGII